MPKRKYETSQQHPIDSSGVLHAAKFGEWPQFRQRLEESAEALTFENFNELPPRSFGVIHQIAFHGNDEARVALEFLLEMHPRVDLKMKTKDGQTVLDVAQGEGANASFLGYLNQRLLSQSHHELINKARDGVWPAFLHQLQSSTPVIPEENINTVPAGRLWGVIHQVSYWGNSEVLETLLATYPSLDLELATNEEAAQLPSDIAIGRGHADFAAAIKSKINENTKPTSLVTAPSGAMKEPVSAAGKLCNICFMEDHEEGILAVSCDNDHYMCQTCFSGWVESESDIEANPQNILLNGGRITCVCKKSDGCDSLAYANKLIAMVVSDELYEKYLRARDFVVGKEAVSGALAKIKGGNMMDAIEQEQIRNMYRTKDGSYSAYMCGQCKFGPIDHGWCSNLQSHHGEKKMGGGHVNNACPKCGWFANCIQQWPKWDGKFQEPGKTVIQHPPVSSMSLHQLRAALKSRGVSAAGNKPTLMERLQALYDMEQSK